MKTNFKRLFALVLTLCMLATLMVPVAFAEDEATETPSANVAETYPIRLKDINHTDPTTATGLDALMVKTNAAGETRYYSPALTDFAAEYAAGTLNWNGFASYGEVTYRSDMLYQVRLANKSAWNAIKIRVSEGGLYALNLATDKTVDTETEVTAWTNESSTWAGNVTAYIIPVAVANEAVANAVIPEVAEGETAPTAEQVAIQALMTDEYSVGTVAMAAEDTSVTFAKTRMEAGEYVVVYQASAGNYTISEMSLLGDAYVMEEVASYALRPFDMTNTDPATYAGTINEQLATVAEDGTVTWAASLSVAKVLTSARYASLGVQYLTVSGSSDMREYNLMQLRLKTAGDWVALKLNVSNSGEQYLTLTSDKSASIEGFDYTNNYTAWAGDVTAYLLPLSDLAATDATTVGAAMTADNCIGTKTMWADDTSVTFDKKYMEAGEYVLIFTATKGGYSVCEASLSKVVAEALPGHDKVTGTVATYDFELYNNERYAPMFTNADGTVANKGFSNDIASGLEGVYEAGEKVYVALARDYKAGLINWKYHSNTSGLTNHATSNMGIRIQSTDGASVWTALTVNVPAAGIYTADIVSEYTSNGAYNMYVLPADADVAASLTEENKVASYAAKTMNVNFAAEFAAGENIVVFEIAEDTSKSTIYVSSLTLSVLDESVEYVFALQNNEAFMTAMRTAVGDETATATTSVLKSWDVTANGETVAFAPYTTIASLFAEGKMNWALDASSGKYADTLQEDGTYKVNGNDMQNFRGNGDSLRLQFDSSEVSYAGFRIYVPTAGNYEITVNGVNTALNLYLVKAPNVYDAYGDRLHVTNSNGSLRAMIADAEPFAVSDGTNPVVATYTFATSGEYIFAVEQTEAVSEKSVTISSMVMEPAEINVIADGVGYASLEDAIAAATESITLLQDTTAGDVVVPAGVTLDLNGYNLDAASVDFASAADIIDSADGKALLRVSGDITFNEDNAQLPLYNVENNCYKLFNVEVVSSATTGSASATKYWFKVNFSNAEAFELIGMNTELRIQADMTGVIKADSGDYVAGDEWAAVATADVAFTNTWAANSDAYIVVSAVGSNLSSFQLNPGITANGVVISGTAMGKG